jgi:D-lyxose ketol-isomerase
MKRSEINQAIAEAAQFFARQGFTLPPFAAWTPQQWSGVGEEARELRAQRLGWDVTDFHGGRFATLGLTLFTLRNGTPGAAGEGRPYAEKIMFVRQNQVTPFHYHARKMEDIINRGGPRAGKLAVELYKSEPPSADQQRDFASTPVTVACDGMRRQLEPGGTVVLGPGESITLPPYLYHSFHAIDGDALIGEVSTVNDDDHDNFFRDPLPRYPAIDEDEAPLHLLCTEYSIGAGKTE